MAKGMQDQAETGRNQDKVKRRGPEKRQPALKLSDHLDGYWPSSKNITQ